MLNTRYHFIGISGAGMSALAGIVRGFGYKVGGSDLKATGHKAENIKGADIVVYSPAITESSPGWVELQAARKAKIKTLRYDDLLGELTKNSILIAISGMHGKSTTTAMVARIFEEAGLDPTVLVGAHLVDWNSKNFRVGKKDLWILEADDYEKKFLTLKPSVTITTNIDFEHVDTYKNIDEAIETFAKLFNQTKNLVIANGDDFNTHKAVKAAQKNGLTDDQIVWYGTNAKDFNFDILPPMKVIGQHNKSNALAAVAVADSFDISRNVTKKALAGFSGIARRQEFIGEKNGILVFDDYAHHPTELQATIAAFRDEYPDKRLVVAFEPHQHKRASILFDDFAKSFQDSDLVLITDVFGVAGRESKEFVDSRDLAGAIESSGTQVKYVGAIDETVKKLDNILIAGDVLVTMGAGSVTRLGREWINRI